MQNHIRRVLIVLSLVVVIIFITCNLFTKIYDRQKSMMGTSTEIFLKTNDVMEVHGNDHDLPFTFSLLCDNTDTVFFVFSGETNKIISSNMRNAMGFSLENMNISPEKITSTPKGFYFAAPNGEGCYGVFIRNDNYILCRAQKVRFMFSGIALELLVLLLYCILFFIVYIILISAFIERTIVNNVNNINAGLHEVIAGNLNVKVTASEGPELTTMAKYINQLVERLKRDLNEDPLTGLYSRRAFYNEIEKIYSTPSLIDQVAVFMVDADGLKKVNDNYGQEVGDVYLKKIGDLLMEHSCCKKIIARLGGDEFGIILYKTRENQNFDQMLEEYKQIRQNVNIVISAVSQINVSFSIGMAYAPADGDNYHLILKKADERMSQDKAERKLV